MKPFKSIVVPTDFSDGSRNALSRAVSFAKLDGASIHLVHALRLQTLGATYDYVPPDSVWQAVRLGAQERIETLRKEVEAEGIAPVTTEISELMDPSIAIEHTVETNAADLVVMGTHGYSGLKHAFLGSLTERTIRKLTCPVLATKGSSADTSSIRRILLPVDFSSHSSEAATVAADLAQRLGAAIDLLHIVEVTPEYALCFPPEAVGLEKRLQTLGAEQLQEVARLLSKKKLSVDVHVVRGAAGVAVAEEAKLLESDLIVMGTHGHTGLTHLLLGSVAERTLRAAPCSVLAVKARRTAPRELPVASAEN